jgi:hypothetical protein
MIKTYPKKHVFQKLGVGFLTFDRLRSYFPETSRKWRIRVIVQTFGYTSVQQKRKMRGILQALRLLSFDSSQILITKNVGIFPVMSN